MELDTKDPPQSRVSTAQFREREQNLMDHQMGNFKNQFSTYFQMIASGLKDNKEAYNTMIKPEFYVKNVLKSYYDRK